MEKKTTEEVRALCAEDPKIAPFAYVVGRWVWATFNEKPEPETLRKIKSLGFRWNKARRCWQNPCGHFTRRARGYDPRDKYGMEDVQEGATR